jgi:peptidoglycan hydrolase-like protein with peptidoglycan-binding domain
VGIGTVYVGRSSEAQTESVMGIRNLRKGMTGPDVRAIQKGLNARNPKNKIDEDGDFGPETDRAVRDYQRKNGLDPDGVVGPLTRASLFPIGVATVAIYAARSQSPALQPLGSRIRHPGVMTGHLHLDYDIVKQFIALGLVRPLYAPLRLPGLAQPLPAPVDRPCGRNSAAGRAPRRPTAARNEGNRNGTLGLAAIGEVHSRAVLP